MDFATTIHDKALFSWSSIIVDYEETLSLDLFLKFLNFFWSLDSRLEVHASMIYKHNPHVNWWNTSLLTSKSESCIFWDLQTWAWWTLRLRASNAGLLYKTRVWSSWKQFKAHVCALNICLAFQSSDASLMLGCAFGSIFSVFAKRVNSASWSLKRRSCVQDSRLEFLT